MAKQIPRGDDNLICPLHKATMETVCHKCPWWFSVRGQNPNTGEQLDEWKCAVALLPLLLIENAQRINQMGAAMESMRNETVKAHSEHLAMASIAVHRAKEAVKEAVQDGVRPILLQSIARLRSGDPTELLLENRDETNVDPD